MHTTVQFLKSITLTSFAALLTLSVARAADNEPPAGFISLFNGRNFTGWTVPAGDNGHWKVVDGVIDYDARSEAAGDKNLWSARVRRLHSPSGLADQRDALHQSRRSLRPARWHVRPRHAG